MSTEVLVFGINSNQKKEEVKKMVKNEKNNINIIFSELNNLKLFLEKIELGEIHGVIFYEEIPDEKIIKTRKLIMETVESSGRYTYPRFIVIKPTERHGFYEKMINLKNFSNVGNFNFG